MERRQPERSMERLDILIEKVNQMERDFAVVKSFINSESGNHMHHLDAHHRMLEKHNESLYGNGKPGITQHIQANMEAMKMLNADFIAHKTNFKWMVTTVVLTLIGIVVKMSWPG